MFTPYPFQLTDVDFMRRNANVLNANEMGLGKTIECIMLLNSAKAGKLKDILIITPASLKYNWKQELEDKLSVDASISVVNGGLWETSDITIINYDIVFRHKEELWSKEWSIVIADEAHYIKNAAAKRSKTVRGITARRKILLTGTPIANKPIELWALLDYLQPKAWGTYHKFAFRYCNPKRGMNGWEFKGVSHADELMLRLKSVMIRNLKEDVLQDLPDKVLQIVEIDPSSSERKVLGAELNAAGGGSDPEAIIKAIRVKSLENSGDEEHIATMRSHTGLIKLPHIIEHLETATNKVVCFCHHKKVIAGLVEHFGKRCVSITGSTPNAKRQEIVNRFQNDAGIKFFIGNIKAAGVGLTLTAASHVVFGELDFVPANMHQAADRCHRIGQKESVLIQYLVMRDSLDAVMAKMIVSKQEIIREIINSELDFLN